MIFAGQCEAIPLLFRFFSDEFCSDPGWDRQYAHDLIRHFATAFLLDTLGGAPAAHEALLPIRLGSPALNTPRQSVP
jgi:hypothetical protein